MREATAHFTFAVTAFVATPLVNGALNLAWDPMGDDSVYMQRTARGNIDRPERFAAGECIATLWPSRVVLGATVTAGTEADAVECDQRNADRQPAMRMSCAAHVLSPLLGQGALQYGNVQMH